jgi:endoglucanase
MIELLKTLAEAWGPPGYEHGVRALIEAAAAPYADHIATDALGNLLVTVRGTGGPGAKRILVAAHMDEIGLMTLYREPNSGYLRFTPLGGLLNTALLGARVRFENGALGVVSLSDAFTTHRTQAPDTDGFFIDTDPGAETGEAVGAGSPAVFWGPVEVRGRRVVGKAMDDRAGCTVALEALRRLNRTTPHEVVFAFTVQEEVGIRGARTAAFGVAPDIAIAIDVTSTGDMLDAGRMEVRLGGGAAIKLHDLGLVVPPSVRDWMIARAEADGIPYQRELLRLGTTDASQMQVAGAGAAAGAISIPCRYVHTTAETVDLDDMEACAALLTGLLAHPVAEDDGA